MPLEAWIAVGKYHKHRELCVEIFWSNFKASIRAQLSWALPVFEAEFTFVTEQVWLECDKRAKEQDRWKKTT